MKQPQDPIERQVLKAIKALLKENGYAPSMRELCAYPGMVISSSSTMHEYVCRLEDGGFITKTPCIARSIRVVSAKRKVAA